jgi:hypothetical protein
VASTTSGKPNIHTPHEINATLVVDEYNQCFDIITHLTSVGVMAPQRVRESNQISLQMSKSSQH